MPLWAPERTLEGVRRRIWIPGAPAGPRQPPVLVAYTETTWTGNGAKSTADSLSWQTGDRLVVLGIASSEFGDLPDPTATGLTFAAGTPINQSGLPWMNTWTATAGSGGSGTIDSTGETGSGAWGMSVWQWRGSDGFGTPASDVTTAKTVSLTRTDAESAVVAAVGDFNAGSTSGYAFTPTITGADHEREVSQSANMTVYVADWVDEDAAGTTSYGVTGIAGAGVFGKIAVEILGMAAAPSVPDRPPVLISQYTGFY